MKRILPICAILACVAPLSLHASLVYDGLVTFQGTGLGHVPTILTVQNNGTESGCVAFIGGVDVIGPTACEGGIAGGNEKTGSSQTQTQLVSAALSASDFTGPISSYGDLAVVLNGDQPNGGNIDLSNLVLTLTGPNGTYSTNGITGCPNATCTVPTLPGIGNSGYAFQISADQAAAALKALGGFTTSARVGLSATLGGGRGGPETFFLAAVPALASAGGGQVPEPTTLLLLLSGSALLLFGLRRKTA
ncbi:MAG TPA: PEP-CTERM sorting domain-containing protein [Bryobacteraceae bacterium]|nr:PEP-CTERM sorting domain-containing protein [Bryobacteraceae bacterium]